jgi:hypothetical protein
MVLVLSALLVLLFNAYLKWVILHDVKTLLDNVDRPLKMKRWHVTMEALLWVVLMALILEREFGTLWRA